MLVVLLLGVTIVYATDDTLIINGSNTIVGGNEASNTATNTANTAGNTIIQAGNTANTSVYNNTTNLPQTGADDYAVILAIGIFAIAAVYTYKRIRDYKNI